MLYLLKLISRADKTAPKYLQLEIHKDHVLSNVVVCIERTPSCLLNDFLLLVPEKTIGQQYPAANGKNTWGSIDECFHKTFPQDSHIFIMRVNW